MPLYNLLEYGDNYAKTSGSFRVEHIPKEINQFINNKNMITSIYGIQGYYFKGKTLTDYTNLFSPNNFKKKDDMILNYFLNKV